MAADRLRADGAPADFPRCLSSLPRSRLLSFISAFSLSPSLSRSCSSSSSASPRSRLFSTSFTSPSSSFSSSSSPSFSSSSSPSFSSSSSPSVSLSGSSPWPRFSSSSVLFSSSPVAPRLRSPAFLSSPARPFASSAESPRSSWSFSSRLASLRREARQFWNQKSLQQKVKYSSLLLNTAFIAFMSSRLFEHQRSTDMLFEEELKRRSGEAEDWKCYHTHRLFYSQCRDLPTSLWGRSGVRTPGGGPEALQRVAGDGGSEEKEVSRDAVPVDFLCARLEGELEKCRDSLARHIPDETPAMKEITDITNLPPWLKDRPVYVQFFQAKAKRQRNREEENADSQSDASPSCPCSL
ncbi:hypothetical protein TGVEG_235730 [Toxoplasma gondii VEG]|uniref:Uncharacterized protein n=1 Tax=Toxoplasma gondii (strain ATCC 50861 / VEG) TaxID=432359 RepID=V4Z6B8_TOXGV|nr:hypothetical protein TGVEG_235730 [Toxoplasma gondii VEG]CEL76883.1 TPA: hypothetical protein BN1205_061545 [Toxoplasma gondii VEG]